MSLHRDVILYYACTRFSMQNFMEFCHFILLPIEEGKCIIIISFENLLFIKRWHVLWLGQVYLTLQLSRVQQFLHGWFAEWFLLILFMLSSNHWEKFGIILNVHWQYDTITGLLLAHSSHLDIIMIVSGTRGRKVGGSLGLSRGGDYCLKPST